MRPVLFHPTATPAFIERIRQEFSALQWYGCPGVDSGIELAHFSTKGLLSPSSREQLSHWEGAVHFNWSNKITNYSPVLGQVNGLGHGIVFKEVVLLRFQPCSKVDLGTCRDGRDFEEFSVRCDIPTNRLVVLSLSLDNSGYYHVM